MSNQPGSNEDEKLNESTGAEQRKEPTTLTIDIERQKEADRKAEQNLERGDKEHGKRIGA